MEMVFNNKVTGKNIDWFFAFSKENDYICKCINPYFATSF